MQRNGKPGMGGLGLDILIEAAKYLEYKAAFEECLNQSLKAGIQEGVVPNSFHPLGGNLVPASTSTHQTHPQNGYQYPHPLNNNNGQRGQFGVGHNHNVAPEPQPPPYNSTTSSVFNHHNSEPWNGISFLGLTSPSPGTSRESNSSSPSSSNNNGRQRSGGHGGTREVHNALEKGRREHLKNCFANLKSQLPELGGERSSHLGILRNSIKRIQILKREQLRNEWELDVLARENKGLKQRLAQLENNNNNSLECLENLDEFDDESSTVQSL